jgi:hypothetical protein
MVYSGDKAPDPLPGERLSKSAIKVLPKHRGEALVASSRLDLAKIYTVEHNLPVCAVGEVDKKDLPLLEKYFREIHKDLLGNDEEEPRDSGDDDEQRNDDDGDEEQDGDEEEEGNASDPSTADDRRSYSTKSQSSKRPLAPAPDKRRLRR